MKTIHRYNQIYLKLQQKYSREKEKHHALGKSDIYHLRLLYGINKLNPITFFI